MKSSLRFWTAIVAAAISFSAMTSLRAVDMATPATKQEVQEDLGYDNYKGKSHKIARVYYVTPVAVQVIYEGEKGGRNIPRNDLPPQLKVKYPYDPEAAAEFVKTQAQKINTQTEARRTALESRAKELQNTVNDLGKLVRGKQQEIASLSTEIQTLPKDAVLRQQKVELLRQMGDLQRQYDRAREQLAVTRKQINTPH